MRKLSGVAQKLEQFIESQNSVLMSAAKLGGHTIFLFEIQGLPHDWHEGKELELTTQDTISVHRTSGEFYFKVIKQPKAARDEFAVGREGKMVIFDVRQDGTIANFRNDAEVKRVGDRGIRVTVSPGVGIEGFPARILPQHIVEEEVNSRATEIVEVLIRCGQLVNTSRSIPLDAGRRTR